VVQRQVRRQVVGAALVERGAVRGREVLAPPVADVRLGRAQVVPVGLRLHPDPLDVDEWAIHPEQPLDDPLGLLVPALAEVVVADDALRVDEVERRPVVVVEGGPDRVVAVDDDRVVDRPLLRRLPDQLDLVLERELRRVHPDDDQPVLPVGL
jgi:hypothetical protein